MVAEVGRGEDGGGVAGFGSRARDGSAMRDGRARKRRQVRRTPKSGVAVKAKRI